MKKTLTILTLWCLTALLGTAIARPVNVDNARTVAINFLKAYVGTDFKLTQMPSSGYSEFYIFQGTDGKGFVLVSADDCVKPILGYSTTNSFAFENMPTNVKGWLDDYEAQIAFYRQLAQKGLVESSDSEVKSMWDELLKGKAPKSQSKTSVSPLVSTTWDQSPYYNNLCPYSSYYSERTVTGCVATATAQVMKYYNHPSSGYGSYSYYHSTFGTLSANFGTTTYAWSSMPTALTSSSTTAQVNAVATLMYHVGVAMEMDYDVSANGGSGALTYSYGSATTASAENALRTYFKYKSSLHNVMKEDYTDAEWSALLMNELNNSRPVLYSGRDSSGGHCFVCDGYSNSGQFHFNWGWGGWCDGYYTIGNLHPASGGTGGNSSYTFDIRNAAVIGIEPNNSFGGSTTVNATSSNVSYGTVTGGGTYTGTNSNTVSLTATAASGCKFTGWNDNYKYNPRQFLANGGNYTFTANFEHLSGDTLGYCNNYCITSYGDSWGTTYWGIKLPASVLTAGHSLKKIAMYVAEAGSYTLTVYTGYSSPSTTLYTQTFNAGSAIVDHWGYLTLTTPVSVDGTQPLWIILSSNGNYPAAVSYGSGNGDARIWGSSFSPLSSDYSFMIRGIFEADDTPVVLTGGDTLSYCADSSYFGSVGAGGTLTWGVRFLPTALSGHDTLSDVRLFVCSSGTYDLTIYQGSTTSTATQVATMSRTFSSSTDSTWQNFHLTTPVVLDQTQPLWIVFYNTGVTYPAARCNYMGDSNSSLVYLGSAWKSLYTAAGGSFNGSWMIQAITHSASGSTSTLSDTVSYCGDSSLYNAIGTGGGSFTWGIRIPASMHSHRTYLTDVMMYVYQSGAYTLNVYQGNSTTSSTLAATQTANFTTTGSWQTIPLNVPVTLNSTQPLWITFTNNSQSYPAAICDIVGDSNSSLISVDSGATWYTLYDATSGSIDGVWMIRAILSNAASYSVAISGPTTVTTGTPATFTANGPAGATYSWILNGATPSTATGSTATATWNTVGTYNVILVANYMGTTLRDTLQVAVSPSSVTGNYLSYCPDSTYYSSCGAGGNITWGVRFPTAMLSGHDTLTDVRLFVISGGTYTLNVYQGASTSTATQVATMSYTFSNSADSTWQIFHLSTPVVINHSQPLWVVFSNSGVTYPAAYCNYVGDTNSNLVYLSGTWMSLGTATGGSFNGSWLIQAVTRGAGSIPPTPTYGDTVSFCGDSTYQNSIGTGGGTFSWGIRIPASMHSHRAYLTDVMMYVYQEGQYTLNVYQGSTTTAATLATTQTVNFASSTTDSWQTIHLYTPVTLNSTQPLWITFTNQSQTYPAAICNVPSDANNSLVSLDTGATWYTIYDATDGGIDGAWMIRAILANSTTPSITITGPTSVVAGDPATFTAIGPSGVTYTWTLAGATPSTATGTSVTATWNTAGLYNVIVSASYMGNILRDTLQVTVTACNISSFPYTMGFESYESLSCWSFIDNDNDGYGWQAMIFDSTYAHSGSEAYSSASYINNIGALTPDNWMVMPPMSPSAGQTLTMTWYDRGTDDSDYADHYGVFVSTTNASPSSFTLVQGYTCTGTAWTQRTLDLSAYAGQTIRIAFRHYNCTNMYWLLIDDITVSQSATSSPTVNISCSGNGSGAVYKTNYYSDNRCGHTDTYTSGFYASYDFLPDDGSELSHLYVNNVDRINDVTTHTSATYGTIKRFGFTATNVTMNAVFSALYYQVSVTSANPSMGMATGSGNYRYDSIAVVTAVPMPHYHFTYWNVLEDGETDTTSMNPISFNVRGNISFVAHFAPDTYTINAEPNNVAYGNVTGSGTFTYLDPVTLTATAYSGYRFLMWDNGVTYNPYTFPASQDLNLIAVFVDESDTTEYFSITVDVNDAAMGIATGGGMYTMGDTAVITATAYSGYHFEQWQDGDTSNPRQVVVLGNASYTAYFAQNQGETFTITASSNDSTMGYVTGGGVYNAGATAFLTAVPYDGYVFAHWQDDVIDNPREITITADADYVAYFRTRESIEEADAKFTMTVYPNPTSSTATIALSGINGEVTLTLIDASGRRVYNRQITCYDNCTALIQADRLVKGVYFLQVTTPEGTIAARKLIVQP